MLPPMGQRADSRDVMDTGAQTKRSQSVANAPSGATLFSILLLGIGCGDDTGVRPGADAAVSDSGGWNAGALDGGASDVGLFHVAGSAAPDTCLPCHASQRPDLQPGANAATAAALVGFDHAPTAEMDCIGCHAATVVAGRYVDYVNPTTLTLPGGDWKGGQSFPGSLPVGFPGERTELRTTTLTLATAGDRVLSAVVDWEEIRNIMIHTAAAIPTEIRPAPAGTPDYGKCWHCHVSKHGVVTSFPPGKFHYALAQYAAIPDGPTTPLPQPTQGCKECHAATQPVGIVAQSTLRPMRHGTLFAAPTTIAGVLAAGVPDLDCSTCHHDPLGEFADGDFHHSAPAATLQDCVSCHYVTMADASTADTQSGSAYRMQHLSAQMPFHTCPTCHPSALASAANPTFAAESWKPGRYHAVLPAQPTACADCHAVSAPTSHSAIADPSYAQDCGECHTFPGSGTLAAPNWTIPPAPAP
jgi:hypothetical protein